MFKYFAVLMFGAVSASAFAAPPVAWQPPQVQSVASPATKIVTVYKFFSKTCVPCIEFAPTFTAWRQRLAGQGVKFVELDGDLNAADLAVYEVTSYPTVVVCDGTRHYKFEGIPAETQVVRALQLLGVSVSDTKPTTVTRTITTVKPAVRATTATHSHRCGNCGTVWTHGPEARHDPKGHHCPTCGSGPWLRVHETFSN